MKKKYFGTDGIRGLVGQAPITPDFVLKFALGRVPNATRSWCTRMFILLPMRDMTLPGWF